MNTGEHAQTAKCLRCGRTLRSASSVAAGYGRWCRAKIRAAAIAAVVRDFKGAQVEKARDLIADGGLVPTNRDGVFHAVSSKGDGTVYLTHSATCTCPAATVSRRRNEPVPCYHSLAALIVIASKVA